MTIYTDKDKANNRMRIHNQATVQARDFYVLVDGPEEGEVAVMTLREAQDNGFLYSIAW
jgi:hypothetical protein